MDTIYTIGHAGHPFREFIRLLHLFRITRVVDVRTQPVSRFTDWARRESLSVLLERMDVEYHYQGDRLGGQPDGEEFYDDRGYVLYGRIAETPDFQEGLQKLLKLGQEGRTAIMCAEEDPTDCHRRLLVGRALEEQHGVGMQHIREGGRLMDEETIARKAGEQPDQLGLFGLEETLDVPGAWRSQQPAQFLVG